MKLVGWIGKRDYENLFNIISKPYPKYGYEKAINPVFYKTKGKKEFWSESDWPPKKVVLTIGEVV